MKSLLRYKIVFAFFLLFFSTSIHAQIISDTHISKNYNCTNCNLKSAAINDFKIVRVNIHFITKSDGSGNFNETDNINGVTSSENGYWLAEKVIDKANQYLNTNLEMAQQLSYSTIPVEDINYNYKLNGVFFHRSTNYYECFCLPASLNRNNGSAINLFLFSGGGGSGAAGYNSCWVGGMNSAYNDYIANNSIWYIDRKGNAINHEIGHNLSLDHTKRRFDGDTCVLGGVQYMDNCDDTPTYMELINDGYTTPYRWCGVDYSNNIMDYSCEMRAYTPCQIEQVHSYLENVFFYYQYGHYQNANTQITSFTDNMAYIANTVEIPSGSSISIPNNKRLYIDAEEFLINGEFEVPVGSVFEFIPSGM